MKPAIKTSITRAPGASRLFEEPIVPQAGLNRNAVAEMEFKHDCRGLRAKQEIIRRYQLRILNRWKVLNRKKPLAGCCGPLVDEAYTFDFEDRANAAISGTFHVGYHCAEQFLDLLNLPLPPVVDLLLGSTEGRGGKPRDSKGTANNRSGDWSLHPLNREVELAVVILLQAWGTDPREPLRELLKAVRSRPLVPVPDWRVRALITVISYDQQHRTLAQMVQDLREDNPGMLQPAFPEILKRVEKLKLSNRIQ